MRWFSKPIIVFISGLFTLLIVGPVLSQNFAPQQQENHPIRLKMGTFIPAAGQTLALPRSLQTSTAMGDIKAHYYIVQFAGPIEQAWKNDVTAIGGRLAGYIPDFAFKVKLTAGQAAQVGNLSYVQWIGLFEPGYRIDPFLTRGGKQFYKLRFEEGSSQAANTRSILETGAQLLHFDDQFAVVIASSNQVDSLANIIEVAWIEDYHFYEKHNEYGAGVIIRGNIAHANGYDGSSQIVAVADTGFGTGITATAHQDVPASRIVAIQDFPAANVALCYNAFPDGAQDPDSGHGTHVALSVLGAGDLSGLGRGSAPAASLVFQAVEDYIDTFGLCAGSPDGYYLVGLPGNLADLYLPAFNAGARVHSNSWGSNAAGDYTADSAITDQFIWDNPDMLISFSAGNYGADNDSNGIVDNDSIGSPATA